MKEFMQVLRRFVPPYKRYLVLSVVFNILSAVLNIFSFAALIPILQILFQTGDAEAATELMAWDWGNAQAVLMNNLNYYVNGLIASFGPTTTLLFIGLFLAFGVGDFTFDKGGFAAFIMLCGITVNAGIYLVSEYLHSRHAASSVRTYVRAFNHKIIPISLTILSTILGLVPFLFDGPTEVFWFAFAIGTIAGMAFSILALIFYLPVFALRKP